jgi:hypothetical protein
VLFQEVSFWVTLIFIPGNHVFPGWSKLSQILSEVFSALSTFKLPESVITAEEGFLPFPSEDQTMDPPYDRRRPPSTVRLKTPDVLCSGHSLLATQAIVCCEAVAYQIPTYHSLTLLLVRLKNPNLKTPFLEILVWLPVREAPSTMLSEDASTASPRFT